MTKNVQGSTTATGDRLRVLAVDDEPAMGKKIARVLRPAGHQVVTATSGEDALERLTSERFDVLISDIGMGPGMNGWELVERARRSWPHMRVVVATGWGAAIDAAEARARGVDVVIAKPLSPGGAGADSDCIGRNVRSVVLGSGRRHKIGLEREPVPPGRRGRRTRG